MTKYSIHNVFVRHERYEKCYYMGVSELFLEQLDDIEYISLPSVGEIYEEGEFCAIDTISDTFEFISPVSGEIVEVNEELQNNPKLILKDPEFSGWVCKIKLSDKSELNEMMHFEKYRDYLDGNEEYYD